MRARNTEERDLQKQIQGLREENIWLRDVVDRRANPLRRFWYWVIRNQLTIVLIIFGGAIFFALLEIRNNTEEILRELRNGQSVEVQHRLAVIDAVQSQHGR
jgi:hypothetical protein